jgi:hypothetical protein
VKLYFESLSAFRRQLVVSRRLFKKPSFKHWVGSLRSHALKLHGVLKVLRNHFHGTKPQGQRASKWRLLRNAFLYTYKQA